MKPYCSLQYQKHLGLTLLLLGHGDSGTQAEPPVETPCLRLSVSAQMSGLGLEWKLLWEPCSSEWASWPSRGVSAAVRLLVSPLPGSLSLGLLETRQVGSCCCCCGASVVFNSV